MRSTKARSLSVALAQRCSRHDAKLGGAPSSAPPTPFAAPLPRSASTQPHACALPEPRSLAPTRHSSSPSHPQTPSVVSLEFFLRVVARRLKHLEMIWATSHFHGCLKLLPTCSGRTRKRNEGANPGGKRTWRLLKNQPAGAIVFKTPKISPETSF